MTLQDGRKQLQDALSRYGLASSAPEGADTVTVEYVARVITVRFVNGEWWRPIRGTNREALVARAGAEQHLARALAGELRGRL